MIEEDGIVDTEEEEEEEEEEEKDGEKVVEVDLEVNIFGVTYGWKRRRRRQTF